MAGAEMWQRTFAAKDRRAAKRGMFLGTAIHGVTILLVYFMGAVGRQILGGSERREIFLESSPSFCRWGRW